MSQETIAFVNRFADNVIESVKGSGIFPSVKMAQMIIESSGNDEYGNFKIGRGLAVRKANNYFGIKADNSWKGRKVALSTPRDGKPVSYFRVYNNPLESMKDHTAFLLKNSRYRTNGVFIARTPAQQADALQRAGYAESQSYSIALKNMIAAYHLFDLDVVKVPDYKTICLAAGGVLVLSGLLYFQDDLKNQFNQLFNKPKLAYG